MYNDLELTTYSVETGAGATIPREYAYVGAVVGIYEAARGLEPYAGPGIEVEKHENFFVLKAGFGYGFAVANKWMMGFTFAYDSKTSTTRGRRGLGGEEILTDQIDVRPRLTWR